MQNLKILFDTIYRTHFLQEDLGNTTEDKQRNENINVYIDMTAILAITFLKVFLKTLSERCRYQMNIMNEIDILFSDYDSVCTANRNLFDLNLHYYNRAINYQTTYR